MSGHSDQFRHDLNINVVTGVPPRRRRQLQLFKVMFAAFESTLAKVEFVWKTAISPAAVTLSSAAEAMAMLAAGPTARLLPQVEEVGATGPLSLPGPRTRDPWESAAVQTNKNNHIPYVASRHGALTQAKQT